MNLEAFYAVIFTIGLILLWAYLTVDKNFFILGNKIPGPAGLPIVGNALEIPKNGPGGFQYRREIVKKYGHITRLWLGNILVVFLSDPDDCEVILKDTTFLNKSSFYDFFHPWLGTGLLTSGGEKWHKRRKAITPTFHFKILEQFISVFNKKGNILIDCLKKQSDGVTFDIQPYISRYTLDVICETAMGTFVNAQIEHESTYFQAVRRMCDLMSDRFRKPWLQNRYIYVLSGRHWEEQKLIKILHDQTDKVIKEKNKHLSQEIVNERSDEGVKSKTAFLELLLKMKMAGDSAFQSDKDVREEVDTFMFEGHDTTTAAICFALVLLSKHLNVQEKIYSELIDLIEPENFDNVSYEQLQKMKYLENVIKETLRLFPSVPVIGREIHKDLHLPSGYTIPAGTVLSISIYFLHRNEKYFANPNEFNPDNFNHENTIKRHPYVYIPFSAGPRNCIGQKFAMLELKSVLSKIILNYIIEPSSDTWDVIEDPNIVFQSVGGHKIKLRPRK